MNMFKLTKFSCRTWLQKVLKFGFHILWILNLIPVHNHISNFVLSSLDFDHAMKKNREISSLSTAQLTLINFFS